MAMPQPPVGLDMKLSQPNKLWRPKFNFKMAVYFRGGLFPWVFFRGGLFPRPQFLDFFCYSPLSWCISFAPHGHVVYSLSWLVYIFKVESWVEKGFIRKPVQHRFYIFKDFFGSLVSLRSYRGIKYCEHWIECPCCWIVSINFSI